MPDRQTILLAAAVLGGLAVLPSAGQARTVVPYGGYNHHATVMNNIARAQQRNDAAISHVQNNIRSTRPKVY